MLSVESVRVCFDGQAAVDDVSFDVADHEIVVILGSSGCGKSTLLRAIAGLQPVETGRIVGDGKDLVDTPAYLRGIGMMFQDHALFPHRNVSRNIEFGLRMQRIAPAERSRRVGEILELVGLPGFQNRSVGNLSGGEAQRVALARALAPRPRVVLLDEPLGSLDRELRDRLVDELPDLLREVGISAVHVTHDHDEAFAIADKLVVMGDGRVLRSGSPMDVWANPGTEDVARFLGHRNIVDVGIRGKVPWGTVEAEPGRVVVLPDAAHVVGPGHSRRDEQASILEAEVVTTRFRGGQHEVEVVTADGSAHLVFLLARPPAVGDRVALGIDCSRISAID